MQEKYCIYCNIKTIFPGKTTVLVEIIRQLIQSGEKIIACASSNTAVDNIVEKLEIIDSILNNVGNKLLELNMGISIIDIQIKRVSYNKQVQNKLFNRMISEQNMIAEKYRAQGQGSQQEILGKQIQKEKEIK